MAVATVLVVHHEQQYIPSKQRIDTITVIGDYIIIHHEQQYILSKQRIDTTTVIGD